jgi:hypothetical protein
MPVSLVADPKNQTHRRDLYDESAADQGEQYSTLFGQARYEYARNTAPKGTPCVGFGNDALLVQNI